MAEEFEVWRTQQEIADMVDGTKNEIKVLEVEAAKSDIDLESAIWELREKNGMVIKYIIRWAKLTERLNTINYLKGEGDSEVTSVVSFWRRQRELNTKTFRQAQSK